MFHKKLLWFAFTLTFVPSVAWGAGFSMTPMLQEVDLDDVSTEETSVTLTNETTESVTFDVSTIDFKSLDQSGGVAFLGATGLEQSYALAQWMNPDRNTVTLAPNESQEIRVTIKNDPTLSPGGHYGALVLRQVSSGEPATLPKIALQELITSLFFVKKNGGAIYGLELERWEQKKSIFQLLQAQKLTFRATGNVHMVPRGEVKVVDPLGRRVAKGVINEASSLILPETDRDYSVTFLPLLRTWIPGWYHFTLEYRYDGKTEMEAREKSIFFIPPQTVVVAGILFGIFFVGYRSRGRRWRRTRLT